MAYPLTCLRSLWMPLNLIYFHYSSNGITLLLSFLNFRYTNHHDWPIRDKLDKLEETISTNLDKAIEEHEEFLKEYPDSPRAFYLKIRVEEMKLQNETKDFGSETYKKQINDFLDKYQVLMNKYIDPEDGKEPDQYEIMPVMFYSLFHHTVQICDSNNFTRRQNEFLEIGLTKGPKEIGIYIYIYS